MSSLIIYLPRYYQDSPPVTELERVMGEQAEAPGDTAAITDAVNEIKPAHLDWWFTYELAQLLTSLKVGAGCWTIREVRLPMEE